MNFGTNLAAARKAREMSQEELADRLLVSRQTIYKWESSVTYPDIDKLLEIAKALDVSTAYLLGEEMAAEVEVSGEASTPERPVPDKEKTLRHFKGFANVIGLCTMAILWRM